MKETDINLLMFSLSDSYNKHLFDLPFKIKDKEYKVRLEFNAEIKNELEESTLYEHLYEGNIKIDNLNINFYLSIFLERYHLDTRFDKYFYTVDKIIC